MPDVMDEARLQEITEDLKAGRYQNIEEYDGITVGSRVYYGEEQYQATVLAIMESVKSAWSRKYGTRDIEIIVLQDKPRFAGYTRVTHWASYLIELVPSRSPLSGLEGTLRTDI